MFYKFLIHVLVLVIKIKIILNIAIFSQHICWHHERHFYLHIGVCICVCKYRYIGVHIHISALLKNSTYKCIISFRYVIHKSNTYNIHITSFKLLVF